MFFMFFTLHKWYQIAQNIFFELQQMLAEMRCTIHVIIPRVDIRSVNSMWNKSDYLLFHHFSSIYEKF